MVRLIEVIVLLSVEVVELLESRSVEAMLRDYLQNLLSSCHA